MGPDFRLESRLHRQGVWPVAGVDEVGRGPLAGPVAAAAVILDPKRLPRGLNDSKALTQKQREEAFEAIMSRALAVSVAFVTPAEIDAMNIRQASLAAMARAVSSLSNAPAFVLVDGSDPPRLSCPTRAIVKGDALALSISAASIVAKVARDAMMRRLGAIYPQYGFETNVGYAARRHLEALRENGPTPVHRLSFSPLREIR
ncbi:ribonuclease HII [Methylocystis parvus]|uniref:Ribonuclease HII n=1 Tax=Methylocystis parvus TaxID=134 RepID=A0A6B8M706_9HYPH|nr:ribonuclease HII [Methylocystis parvus]QGM97113.1 ribonuclease HII [Methylocystis parvus]WBJ98984.1 ribonuclease HII [Methylocystis parvus OBBP]